MPPIMTLSVADQCSSSLKTLKTIVSILSQTQHIKSRTEYARTNEELDRFSLFVGNIGALHQPISPMSIESRLKEARDVLKHILSLLSDLEEAVTELLEIVSGARVGMLSVNNEANDENGKEISEEIELQEEISETITRLFRVSVLIRQAAPTDIFAKALTRNRYRFNDQFDIAHVGEKYPKLATDDSAWLRLRLGRAITQRRHYLSYIQDHYEKLECPHDEAVEAAPVPNVAPLQASKPMLETKSRPSIITKATTIVPERITPQMLAAEDSPPEEDARSYTTISRSTDGDRDLSAIHRIPKLSDLRTKDKKEIECPFCFRIKKFKNEQSWRQHVFSDLRPYVCTFPDCDAPYFGNINEWFQHEMMVHRVEFECPLCPNMVFDQECNYMLHVKRKHASLVIDEGDVLRDLARKPLAQIPVNDCPCCFEWCERLKERMVGTEQLVANNTLAVAPLVFKRHVGSHLEQLALFAVPIASANYDEKSNAAVEEENSRRTERSRLSALTFQSSPGDTFDVSTTLVADSARNRFSPTNEDSDRDNAGAVDKHPDPPCSGLIDPDQSTPILGSSPHYVFRIDELNILPDYFSENFPPDELLRIRQSLMVKRIYTKDGGVGGRWWHCDGQNIQELAAQQLPPGMTIFRCLSMFFHAGFGFSICNGDASNPTTGVSVQPLRFVHDQDDGYSSYLQASETGKNVLHCRRVDQKWLEMLLPNIYHGYTLTPYSQYGGLKGDLSILLGLITFSMQPEQLPSSLSQMFVNGSWQVHDMPHGRIHERGIRVEIYTCPPDWPTIGLPGSTVGALHKYEEGHYGRYYN